MGAFARWRKLAAVVPGVASQTVSAAGQRWRLWGCEHSSHHGRHRRPPRATAGRQAMTATQYADYARDRTGWFFGMSGPALALVLVAGLPGLAAMNGGRWLVLALWVPAWVLLVALVTVQVRGRSVPGWAIALALHGLGGAMGWTSWQSRAAAGVAADLGEVDLPGVLAGIQIHDGLPLGPTMNRVALVQNHSSRTWAAVARIVHPGIGLAEPGERNRMGAGLAELQEIASAAELIDLLAIQVRTVPDDGAERAAWQDAHRRAGTAVLARQVNDLLCSMLTPASVRTEAFVTIVVGEDRIAKPAKEAGGGIDGRARVLHGAMAEVESRLRGPMGCTQVSWLDSPDLAVAIRTGFAPGERAGLVAAGVAARDNPAVATGVPLAAAGPTRAAAEMRHYDHDAWSSVTDTILLPERGAILGALAPVLAPTTPGERRALTVFYPAMGQGRADRLAQRAQMSAITGGELRRATGAVARAKQRRAQARALGLDEKLAKGRALVRPCAAATVTVPNTWPVSEFGRRLDASIRVPGFIPLRLDLAQDSGFAAGAIPLGVGLPRTRGWR